MPITKPAIGDPTRKQLADDIIDALSALEVDIAALLGERLVTNGSFEIDSDSDGIPDGWAKTNYAGPGVGSITTDVGAGTLSAHGEKAWKYVHPGGALNGGGEIYMDSATFIEVSPLRPYMLTWANKNSVATVTNSVEVLEYDATQSLLATTVVYSETSCPTVWTVLKVTFAPTNALTRYIKLKFKCGETSQSTACDIYIDNVQLQTTAFQNKYSSHDFVMDTSGIPESIAGEWVCPPGVKVAEFELIGGGGGGGQASSADPGAGGGGGGYVRAILAVTPGTRYAYVVGKGDLGGIGGGPGNGAPGDATTIIIGATTLSAGGGAGGLRTSGGTGGAATGGTINTAGADGQIVSIGTTGGYGGYAVPVGLSANGGVGGAPGAAGEPGAGPGSGGGGGGEDDGVGGNGACGAITIRW